MSFVKITSYAFFVILSLALLAGFSFWLLLFLKYRRREHVSLGLVFLEVTLPRDNEIEISAAEQMFSNLYGIFKKGFLSFLKAQEIISFEIVAAPQEIRFIVVVPQHLQALVERQIHGAYPVAEIISIEEYNVFSKTGEVVFAELTTVGPAFFPLRTYENLQSDPLSAITSSMSKMREEESAILQVLISPAGNRWRKKGVDFIRNAQKPSEEGKLQAPIDPRMVEAAQEKCGNLGFVTCIRTVCVGKDRVSAQSNLNNILGSFQQFNNPQFVSLKSKKIWLKKLFMLSFLYRYIPRLGRRVILNTEELATILHFPNQNVQTPHIKWLLSKTSAAPQDLPSQGLYLGKSIFRSMERRIHLLRDDRRRHLYIIGQTGTGKSEFLKFLVQQDIRDGKGVAFIDPHGDAVEDILKMIPKERADDVIYFNPGDITRPMGINILEAETEEAKHMAINSFIALLYKLYDPQHTGIMGPRLERAIRNVMLTAMSEEGNTLVEVLRLLIDPQFAKEKLPMIEDPLVRRYWTDELAQTSDFHKSEVLGYFVSKFDRFVTEKLMRNIIGQGKSAFNFRKLMDERKILLVNLSKGLIGEENSNFLGLLLVPRILIAAMSRVDQPEEERRDFYLYVDEFQNFATPDFAQILAEARKYHLSLIVANQYIGQIEDQIKDAIFGNVGSLVSFRIGVDDSAYLEHQFEPTFTQHDLQNLAVGCTYTRLLIRGQPTTPFSMTSDWPAMQAVPRDRKIGEMIKELSRLRYGRDKEIVEAEIRTRAKLE